MNKPTALLMLSLAALAAEPVFAQATVWRCGRGEYTNDAQVAQRRGDCKVMEGGNVTIVQGARPNAAANANAGGGAAAGAGPVRAPAGPRVDTTEQRARDSEARVVLESELKKAEERRDQLVREYNNGEPEKQGSESRNYQKYLDRVAEMKAAIARNESDIEGIRRELSRLPPTAR